jgi:hypothetical protein
MKTPKLKMPLWQNIVYFLLTVIIPLVFVYVEVGLSKSTGFKVTFIFLTLILVIYEFLKKFIIKNQISKINADIVHLEHDYSNGIGESKLIKHNWLNRKLQEYLISSLSVVILMICTVLMINAIVSKLIQFKGAFIIICLCYFVAFIFKIITYSYEKIRDLLKKEVKSEETDGEVKS